MNGCEYPDLASPIPKGWQDLLIGIEQDATAPAVAQPARIALCPQQTSKILFSAKIFIASPLLKNDTVFVSNLWAQPLGSMYRVEASGLNTHYLLAPLQDNAEGAAEGKDSIHEARQQVCTASLFYIALSIEDQDRLRQGADMLLPYFTALRSLIFNQGMAVALAQFAADKNGMTGTILKRIRKL